MDIICECDVTLYNKNTKHEKNVCVDKPEFLHWQQMKSFCCQAVFGKEKCMNLCTIYIISQYFT